MMIPADRITLEPGSPEWMREMTASKVPAVLGISPWESKYSIWFAMAGYVPGQPQTEVMQRGHDFEDVIAKIAARKHGLRLRPGGCWRNRERPWMVASPDRLAYPDNGKRIRTTTTPEAIVEVKTAADWEDWGPDGSDTVPIYVRAQAVWQCAVLGVPRCIVAVGLPRYTHRTYEVIPNPGEADWLVDQCAAFLKTIEADEPPDVDSDDDTYRVIKAMHPKITADLDVPVPHGDAVAFVQAHRNLRAAKIEAALQTNRLAAHMGLAHRAVHAETELVIAHRIPTNGGDPYVKPVKNLPLIEEAPVPFEMVAVVPTDPDAYVTDEAIARLVGQTPTVNGKPAQVVEAWRDDEGDVRIRVAVDGEPPAPAIDGISIDGEDPL